MSLIPSGPRTLHPDGVALATVALLPLHTVAAQAWIAWKPWIVLLAVCVAAGLVAAARTRHWPWDRALTVAVLVFLISMAASWSGDAPERFARLLLALTAGAAVMLVVAQLVRVPGMLDRVLRTVFWSGAAMAATGFVVSLLSVGAFGVDAIDAANGLPFIDRLTKLAYLDTGFVAVTNWHQDPGYAAAWMNLWAGLAAIAAVRGLGSRRLWLDGLVVGGLWFGVVMTLSRTGILGAAVSVVAFLWVTRDHARVAIRLIGWSAITIAVVAVIVAVADRPGAGGDLGEQLAFRWEQGFSLGPGDGTGVNGGPALDYRGVVWPYYADAFREHPVRGIGLGTGWAAEGVQEPHNLGLQLAGETGLLGILGFAALLVTILRGSVHPVGLAAMVIALSAAFTQTVLFEPTWWFAAGLTRAALPQEPA